MDTFLIFAWDVGSQKLVESCLHHGQMVTSSHTSPNPQRHGTQQCRNTSLSQSSSNSCPVNLLIGTFFFSI